MSQIPDTRSENSEIQALAEVIAERRHSLGISEPQLKTAVPKPLPVPVSPDEFRERQKRAEQIEMSQEERNRAERWASLVAERGERYRSCRLSNFTTDIPSQHEAVEELKSYCSTIRERVQSGDGVVLFGPRGTGKDHLAMAVCRVAIRNDFTVRWQNGMDLFGDIRDAMDVDGESEKRLVERMVRPDILYLSDPLPPIGNLSQFQASMMFRILDGRYSRGKPIVCTVNVSSGAELDERMGPQNGDRVRDGALAIFCNWPSHRKAK